MSLPMSPTPAHEGVPSIYASIQYHSRVNSGAPAVVVQGVTITYRQFCEHIERVTRHLHSRKIPTGSKVNVLVGSLYFQWLLALSLSRLGLASASVSARELDALGPDVILADKPDASPGRAVIEVNAAWFKEGADGLPPFVDRTHATDEPERLVLSSGTTGAPKKVLMTYGQLHARGKSMIADYNLGPSARLFVMTGIGTLIGYKMVRNCWAAGGTVILPTIGTRQWSGQSLTAQPNVIFASPAQLEGLVNSLPPDFMPRQIRIYVAGSTLTRTLNLRTRLRLSPWLYNCYGSTEIGTITLAPMGHTHSKPGLAGYVVPPVRVEIVDENHCPVPRGTVGQIRVKSECQVHSYLEDAKSTAEYFRDGWFYPGDLGALDEHDGLFLHGRVSEVINMGGKKVAPSMIEEALAGVPGVAELAAFSSGTAEEGEYPGVAVVASGELSDDDLHSRYVKAFPGLRPITIHRVDKIPRNEMGKVLRAELTATYGRRHPPRGLLH